MKFNQIVCLDPIGFSEKHYSHLQNYSNAQIKIFDSIPKDNDEILERIAGADAVLLSWNSRLDSETIKKSECLKYIGMCCSLIDEASANVDIRVAREMGIEVLGVRDYGDEGVVEFIFSEIIRLCKGLDENKLFTDNSELSGLNIGIVGMGTLGMLVAKTAVNFGMNVFYHSRSRKQEIESEKVMFTSLQDLAQKSDFVTFHLPRNTKVFTNEHLSLMKDNSVIINTSLSLPFDKCDFEKWLNLKNHFAIMDGVGVDSNYHEFVNFRRAILTRQVTGWTKQAKSRLAIKAIKNLEKFLEEVI